MASSIEVVSQSLYRIDTFYYYHMGINLRNLSTKSIWLRMRRESNACNQNRTHKYDGHKETY